MSSYAELHAHSNFSFMEGASHIEERVLRARELVYKALASPTTTASTRRRRWRSSGMLGSGP